MQQQAETFPAGIRRQGVLPLNESGRWGGLTYPVIVTNIAEGEPSVALSPSHCGHLKKKKKKILAAPALCKDMNILLKHPLPPPPHPKKEKNRNPLEESPRGARMSRSAAAAAAGLALERGQLERADEMEKFQRSNTCRKTIIGDFCHPKKAHDQLPVRVR